MDTQSESLPASERLPSDNEKKVFESCLKAAEQGDAAAQFNLGFYYANGRGVAKDEVEAAKWYRKGAEQGYALAQNNLALCYHNGTGVIQNSIEALNWFEKAAAQGFSRAQCFLAVTTFQSEDFAMVDAALRGGNGTATLKSQTAFAYANKAAEQNLSAAEYLLGEFYRLGYGVKQSSEIALNWYSKAAVNGYQAAKYRVSAQWLIDSTPGSQDASEDNKEYNSRLYSLQNIASQQVDHIWVAKRVLGEIHSSRARAFEDEKSSSIERNRAMFW
jgi:TPR repeat protein